MHSTAAFNVTKRARLPHKIVARARNYDLNCTRTTLAAKHKTWDLCISCRQNSGCEKNSFLASKCGTKMPRTKAGDFSRGVKTTLIFFKLQTRNSLLLPCAVLQFSHKFTSPKNNVRIPYRPKLCEAKLNVSYTSVTCFGGQCLAMHTDFFQ